MEPFITDAASPQSQLMGYGSRAKNFLKFAPSQALGYMNVLRKWFVETHWTMALVLKMMEF
jgi:hypothetical protein